MNPFRRIRPDDTDREPGQVAIRSYLEVGNILGLSSDKVQQIERRAVLRMMRSLASDAEVKSLARSYGVI